jgi:hypothetical protein
VSYIFSYHHAAFYSQSVKNFLEQSSEEILGTLASNSGTYGVEGSQQLAWILQIEILKECLSGFDDGVIFFEFVVPRIGSRVDVVLILGSLIFAIEFKVGETSYKKSDINQAWDYALDLKNFHKASHDSLIIPVLVATEADSSEMSLVRRDDGVFDPVCTNAESLSEVLKALSGLSYGEALNAEVWAKSPYSPTPTIIQAAQALYAEHSVDAISRHDAGAKNLSKTSRAVADIVESSRSRNKKSIVFVTGVPGAGKTLVGLNIATQKINPEDPSHAVFLSGNGPLVDVLVEALTRDEVLRKKSLGYRVRKAEVKQKVKAFIQNVHHFRDAGIRDAAENLPPEDRVVIFDEAQRAWNREMTSSFMQRKKRVSGFDMSEPEFLISYLDRHPDWAVVVCLVGGGQEINRGEAGISAWLEAVHDRFPEWSVYISENLTDSEYAAGHAIEKLDGISKINFDPSLHLSTSMRSFRSEKLSSFVKALLDLEQGAAADIFMELRDRYPIFLSRNIDEAKQWIRSRARGSERFGLVASSGAQRLKPHAIDIRVKVDPVHWFLNDAEDTRSSFYLEDAATEFQVQGLELDWLCVTWDADLRFEKSNWSFNSFVGSKWQKINKPERQQYLLNAYRVLLTRARQGMVIFVPEGDDRDPTRPPSFYDRTYAYLTSLGIPCL